MLFRVCGLLTILKTRILSPAASARGRGCAPSAATKTGTVLFPSDAAPSPGTHLAENFPKVLPCLAPEVRQGQVTVVDGVPYSNLLSLFASKASSSGLTTLFLGFFGVGEEGWDD